MVRVEMLVKARGTLPGARLLRVFRRSLLLLFRAQPRERAGNCPAGHPHGRYRPDREIEPVRLREYAQRIGREHHDKKPDRRDDPVDRKKQGHSLAQFRPLLGCPGRRHRVQNHENETYYESPEEVGPEGHPLLLGAVSRTACPCDRANGHADNRPHEQARSPANGRAHAAAESKASYQTGNYVGAAAQPFVEVMSIGPSRSVPEHL
jgi:hypothetical protein